MHFGYAKVHVAVASDCSGLQGSSVSKGAFSMWVIGADDQAVNLSVAVTIEADQELFNAKTNMCVVAYMSNGPTVLTRYSLDDAEAGTKAKGYARAIASALANLDHDTKRFMSELRELGYGSAEE